MSGRLRAGRGRAGGPVPRSAPADPCRAPLRAGVSVPGSAPPRGPSLPSSGARRGPPPPPAPGAAPDLPAAAAAAATTSARSQPAPIPSQPAPIPLLLRSQPAPVLLSASSRPLPPGSQPSGTAQLSPRSQLRPCFSSLSSQHLKGISGKLPVPAEELRPPAVWEAMLKGGRGITREPGSPWRPSWAAGEWCLARAWCCGYAPGSSWFMRQLRGREKSLMATREGRR